ncbi:MAG TPA: DUF4124 domain-containing protein [Usitatibacter sp.]|nr:DUF4124 domain-containing protein [Usitatibacter sp.]
MRHALTAIMTLLERELLAWATTLMCGVAVGGNAIAADIYKCKGPGGAISVQDQPCPPDSTGERLKGLPPAPPSDIRKQAQPSQRSARSQDSQGAADGQAALRVYEQMIAKLKRGDVEGALSHFTETGRANHRRIFEQLGPKLPEAVDKLGRITTVQVVGDMADLTLERDTPQGKTSFSVMMLRSYDGQWKIDGM